MWEQHAKNDCCPSVAVFLRPSVLCLCFPLRKAKQMSDREWTEYWGWGPDPDPDPPTSSRWTWSTWDGRWGEWDDRNTSHRSNTSWRWGEWGDRNTSHRSTCPLSASSLEWAYQRAWSKRVSVNTEPPSVNVDDFMDIHDDAKFQLTLGGVSMFVHISSCLPDAIVLLHNLYPDQIPDPDALFNKLCREVGLEREYGQPRPQLHFCRVSLWQLLLAANELPSGDSTDSEVEGESCATV
jgi:hypothetical protein